MSVSFLRSVETWLSIILALIVWFCAGCAMHVKAGKITASAKIELEYQGPEDGKIEWTLAENVTELVRESLPRK